MWNLLVKTYQNYEDGKTFSTVPVLKKLDIKADTPIYIGDSNIAHIKSRHPYEYETYFSNIEDIIANPDYVGQNPSDKSIAFMKIYQLGNEYIRVFRLRRDTRSFSFRNLSGLLLIA